MVLGDSPVMVALIPLPQYPSVPVPLSVGADPVSYLTSTKSMPVPFIQSRLIQSVPLSVEVKLVAGSGFVMKNNSLPKSQPAVLLAVALK